LAAGCALLAAVAGVISLRTASNERRPPGPQPTREYAIGVARALIGRVVWVRDAAATLWNGSTGLLVGYQRTDQNRIEAMMSQSFAHAHQHQR